MEHISVTMIRESMADIPRYPLPPGYRIRTYRPGDEAVWAEVETAAGEFPRPERALAHFAKEFAPYPEDLATRCLFLETEEGRGIGTTTAWYHPSFQGQEYGRIHWVGIHPGFQGRGLSKPLVGAAMERLAQSHARAYLTTQTTSWIAIKVYLDFGFVPLPGTPRWEEAWALIAEATRRPELSAFLQRRSDE